MATTRSMRLPPAVRRRRAGAPWRGAAWLVAAATRAGSTASFVVAFAALHAVLWTVCLMSLKAAQDIHMDVAEAYGWGQKFLLGYGKHPPLSGWVAGLWFTVFPVRDWSTYALAMATLGVSLVICWRIALQAVDARRAVMTVLMLAIFPIFNFKGFKYNADLLQLVTLPLIVLAYLRAFEQRTARAGVWLGLAAVAGLMTKYWAITAIGAAGLAALVHPDRARFWLSPAPWVALAVILIGMIPHAWWLVQADFAPLVYADETYATTSRAQSDQLTATYVAHYAALVAAPLLAAALALTGARQRAWTPQPAVGARVDLAGARNVWIIQALLALGPPVAALAMTSYIKTDWGIPLFFLVPLAVMAWPRLVVRGMALVRLAAIWLTMTLVVLVASPLIAVFGMKQTAAVGAPSTPTAQFAAQLTKEWHQRFATRWAAVAGTMEVGEPMTFYSPDHPAVVIPDEPWPSGLMPLDQAKRLGFIGICDPLDTRLPDCERWMAVHAPDAERLDVSARRFFRGVGGPLVRWKIYMAPPAAAH